MRGFEDKIDMGLKKIHNPPNTRGCFGGWRLFGWTAIALFEGAVCVAVLVAFLGVTSKRALAQDGAAPPKVEIERGRGGRKVYRITEEIRIEGKIQKPEAFYVLQKSSINYEWQKLDEKFLPRIIETVSKDPF